MIKGVICIKIGIKDYGYFLFVVKKFMYENYDLELMNIIDGIVTIKDSTRRFVLCNC